MAIKIIVDLFLLDYKYENQKEKFEFIDLITISKSRVFSIFDVIT